MCIQDSTYSFQVFFCSCLCDLIRPLVAVLSSVGKVQVMGGSLAAPWDQLGADRLDALLDKSTKDATVLLRKWLHEALRKEKLLIPGRTRLGAMTPAELASLRVALSSKPDTMIRHLGLLQVYMRSLWINHSYWFLSYQ